MDALENEKAVTVEDICNLPDGQRAELIDGVVYDMASPSLKHQRLVMFLAFRQSPGYAGENRVSCREEDNVCVDILDSACKVTADKIGNILDEKHKINIKFKR